jgi:predicted DNA-binding transcriptional regulator YafY
VSAAGGGPTVDASTLTAVASAARNREQLRFDYLDRSGATTYRTVEPHRLVYTGRRWYLLAWDPERQDWRTFRADRIRPRVPNGPRFSPREPPSGDAAAHVLRGIGMLAWKHQAVFRIHASAEEAADRLQPGSGVISPVSERECELRTGSDSLHDLAVYLGRLDLPFTVLDPPELRALLRTLASRFAAATR